MRFFNILFYRINFEQTRDLGAKRRRFRLPLFWNFQNNGTWDWRVPSNARRGETVYLRRLPTTTVERRSEHAPVCHRA